MHNILKFLRKIYRFYYYGKVGMNCQPYDANCIDDLILAHIKRVEGFMDSDDTHTLWSDKELGLKRKLKEFRHLCELKVQYDDFNDNYEFSKIYEALGPRKWVDVGNDMSQLEPYPEKKEKNVRKAMGLDRTRAESRRKRYYYMLEHYVPGFWD